MIKLLLRFAVIAAAAALALPAAAGPAGCEAKAVDKDGKPLVGEAKSRFLKQCSLDEAEAACAAEADAKRWVGSKRGHTIRQCMARKAEQSK